MKWITRARPKIDRIACPWLIKNFVSSDAEFIYVPKDKVFKKAKELNAISYDLPGAEYTHEGTLCTFDYIVKKHKINDPSVRQSRRLFAVLTPIDLTWHQAPDYGLSQQDSPQLQK